LLEHDRFEELASLAAIGELSFEERADFLHHTSTCSQCRGIITETQSLAAAAFLAGSPNDEDAALESGRHRRLREGIAKRLPMAVPVSFVERFRHVAAAGIAAAFLLGAGVGAAVGYRLLPTRVSNAAITLESSVGAQLPKAAMGQDETVRLQSAVDELQQRMEEMRGDNRALRERLSLTDQHATELETKLAEVEKRSSAQGQEVILAHNELSAARDDLSQAKASLSLSQSKIDSLQNALSDKETRLTEASENVEQERDMLSAGREIRDIMGARDLHIVDVVDRDGKGRITKAFGRAFYTQGKSLIFYAFDLPTKSTADGKFVYAAWGSNSNNLNGKTARSLGIFYNDDQTQHRWAMKFDDPKLLQEIDTVFVTLEPASRPFASPTGKPILEAYFGTPPNHP